MLKQENIYGSSAFDMHFEQPIQKKTLLIQFRHSSQGLLGCNAV